MNQYLQKVYRQIADFVGQLSGPRRIALLGTAAVVIVGIGAMFFWAGEKTFSPLMTNLNPEDAAGIIRVLRDKQIPFTLDSTGRNISVPPENLYQLRLELATAGLPQSGVVGYEVFDKQSIGTTSFVQKLNQNRAREGELMRTIGSIRGVKRSRVHLAMPTKSAFIEDQKKTTASVVLDLEPGVQLSEKQIYGIGNLVARAIEGLEIEDVVVIDSNGKTLSKNFSDPMSAQTMSQLDFRDKIESEVENRIETILSRVVGEGRVTAKVNAEVDFSQIAETQTNYDPEGAAMRSRESDVQTMEGTRPGPVGVAGVQSNQPGQPPAPNAGQVRNDTKKNREIVNMAVPQTVRTIRKPVWAVQKLSVAVLVDGKTVKTTDKDGNVQSKVEAWPAEKLAEFERVVAGAVGIDKKRGDVLEIKNMEFAREDFDEAQKLLAEAERRGYITNLATWMAVGLVIALFFFMVVRPFIKWLTENTIDGVDSFLPQTIEELERLQKNSGLPGMEEAVPVMPESVDPDKVEGEMIKEKVITLVDASPHKAALILRDWLHADSAKKKPSEPGKDGGGAPGKSKTA